MKFTQVLFIFFTNAGFALTTVNSAAQLETAIINANTGGETLIEFGTDITYAQLFRPLNSTGAFVYVANTYTIDGKDFSLQSTGGTPFRGFFVGGNPSGGSGGTITIQNLTIDAAVAKGGDGGTNGGGGGR